MSVMLAIETAGPEQATLEAPLRQAAEAALAARADTGSPVELTIVLSDDRQLQELNRLYREIDAPTDVLAFPSGEIDPESEAEYLGDILISLDRARAQAEAGGHPLEAELQLLVVHGVLHLLGHDHGEPDEKARMWQAQAAVLGELGLDLSPP